MKKYGKKYNKAKSNIPTSKQNKVEAIRHCKENSTAKFDESVDVAFSLGIDTKSAEENIRTTVSLPNGTGKDVKIAVFAGGEALTEAEKAGADIVGGKELATKVASEQKLDVDIVISTPEMMAEVGQLGKILGPQGLMPNPKLGTVTQDIKKAVENAKAGQVQYKNDKAGIVHAGIGKMNFNENDLLENLKAFFTSISKSKPDAVKGSFVKKVTIASTMGVGLEVNLTSLR